MNRIEFFYKSKIELIDAWGWYQSRQKGLGDKFIYEVEKNSYNNKISKKIPHTY